MLITFKAQSLDTILISPRPALPPYPHQKKKAIMVIVNDHRYYKDKIDADHS